MSRNILRFLFSSADLARIDIGSIECTEVALGATASGAQPPVQMQLSFRVTDPQNGAPEVVPLFPGGVRYLVDPNDPQGVSVDPASIALDAAQYATWETSGIVSGGTAIAMAAGPGWASAASTWSSLIDQMPNVAWYWPVALPQDFLFDTVADPTGRAPIPVTGGKVATSDAGWPKQAVAGFLSGRYELPLKLGATASGDDVESVDLPTVVMNGTTGVVTLNVVVASRRVRQQARWLFESSAPGTQATSPLEALTDPLYEVATPAVYAYRSLLPAMVGTPSATDPVVGPIVDPQASGGATPAQVAARAAKRYIKVSHGQTVTLDGSPSVGLIASYQWTFSALDPVNVETNAQAARNAATTQITVLGSIVATLTVIDAAGNSDTTHVSVIVKPRNMTRIQPKRINARAQGKPMRLDSPLSLASVYLGKDLCAVDSIASTVSGDVALVDPTATGSCQGRIHTTSSGNWSAFLNVPATGVSDPGGPFDGAFWVQSHTLAVQRIELLNSEFFPGTDGYEHNDDPDRRSDLETLRASTTAHEAAHTDLLLAALADVDPTPVLEKLVRFSSAGLVSAANAAIGTAENALVAAADEAHVHAVLRQRSNKWATEKPTIMMRAGSGSWTPVAFSDVYADIGDGT